MNSRLEMLFDGEPIQSNLALTITCPYLQSPLPDGSGCGCDPGYTKDPLIVDANAECVPCAAGQFKSFIGHQPCLACSAHFGDQYRAAGIIGAKMASECACVSGGFELAPRKGKSIQQLIEEKGCEVIGWTPSNGKVTPFKGLLDDSAGAK